MGSDFAMLMGLDEGARAEVVVLRLGQQELELVRFASVGVPIPTTAGSNDLAFQHFAIVVADMPAAFAGLQAQPGWRAISRDGPQLLPPRSGGVTAFKFRDPEGHPLELLAFPPEATPPYWRNAAGDVCLGIDHSAIAVADSAISIAFYTRGLGFTVGGHSLNVGREQAALDDLHDPVVEVTPLTPAGSAAPHIELLCYRAPRTGTRMAPGKRSNDLVATRLIVAVSDAAAVARTLTGLGGSIVSQQGAAAGAWLVRDPDGHDLLLTNSVGCS